MQIRLALALDLAVVSTNRGVVAVDVPDNYRVHPIAVWLLSRFLMCSAMLFRLGESMKRLVEQSTNYLLLIPQVEMRLTDRKSVV